MELKDILPFLDPEVLKRWTEYQKTRDWSLVDWTQPKTFTDLANVVRNSGLGGDVREALAKMFEEVSVMVGAGANEAQASHILELIGNSIKKGQVTMADLTQEVKEALTGGSVAVVGRDAVGTENIQDGAVTFEKTDFANEVALRVKNIQLNGSFKDSDGDGVADNWIAGSNTSQHRVGNNAQYWLPSVNTTSGALESLPNGWSKQPKPGHKYFVSFNTTNVKTLRIVDNKTGTEVYSDYNIDSVNNVKLIYSPKTDFSFKFRFMPSLTNAESSVGNLVVADLTESFGAGNEPTAEYFEFLLSTVGIDNWFGGTINLTDVRKNGILSAKDLKVYNPDGILKEDNVEEVLLNLSGRVNDFENNGLHTRSGKNLLNPDKYVHGRLYAQDVGEPLYISEDEEYLTQKVRIDNSQSISLNKLRIYAITDRNNIPVLYQQFPNSAPVTLKMQDIPETAYYLWVTIRRTEKQAQVEFGDAVTPYEPYIPIEGIYAGDIKIFDYPINISGDRKKELHDLALANGAVKDLIEKNDFLKINSTYNFKNDSLEKVPDSATINLKSTDEQKLILHFHKRENDGFDTVNDVYLPNAEDDFSDVQIKSDTGEVLPYRVLYHSNNLDVVPDSRLGINHRLSMIFKNSFGEWITTQYGDLKKSTNEGRSWTIIPAFSDIRNMRISLISKDDTLYFTHEDLLYRSEYPYTDYTTVFDLSVNYPNSLIQTTGMVQHPDGEIFFGTYQIENHILIYRSTDNGLTWEEVYNLEGKYKHVHALYIDEYQNPPALYAGLDHGGGDYAGGVLKTTDKGETWTDLKQQYPDMPMATDFGVTYADPSGYRLLGGETPTGGGYSVIKTTDDVNFRPVLGVGTGVLRVTKKDGRLFAGGSGWLSHKYGTILISENEGENWEQIYTTPLMDDSTGTNDGFRYMSDMGNQIVAGMQSPTRPPVRIFTEGIYAEVVVDVPQGTSSLTVETGKSYPNIKPIHNDTHETGEFLVKMPLNEGGSVIKEEVSGNYYQGDFEWVDEGKHLGFFYPRVYLPSDRKSVLMRTLTGCKVDSSGFDVSGGMTLSVWGDLANDNINIDLFTSNLGDTFKLESYFGNRLMLNEKYKTKLIARTLPETFNKYDLVIDSQGEVSVYNNGHLIDIRKENCLDVLEAINNSSTLTLLKNRDINSPHAIHGFSIRAGVVSREQLREEFNSFVTDNYM